MERYLHLFVDESGQHHRGECYAVAACWCVSSRRDLGGILKPTKLALMNTLAEQRTRNSSLSELKSSALPPDEVTLLVENIEGKVYQDRTIRRDDFPWYGGCPTQFSFHDVNPSLGLETLEPLVGDHRAPETIQLLALTAILNPLFGTGRVDTSEVNSIHVSLDASVWQQAADRISSGIEQLSLLSSDIEFEIRDSKATPGIQLADLAANAWYRHHQRGDCDGAVRALNRLQLTEYR